MLRSPFSRSVAAERRPPFQDGLEVAAAEAGAAICLLNPVIASAAMAFPSVSVVGNALRLRRFGS